MKNGYDGYTGDLSEKDVDAHIPYDEYRVKYLGAEQSAPASASNSKDVKVDSVSKPSQNTEFNSASDAISKLMHGINTLTSDNEEESDEDNVSNEKGLIGKARDGLGNLKDKFKNQLKESGNLFKSAFNAAKGGIGTIATHMGLSFGATAGIIGIGGSSIIAVIIALIFGEQYLPKNRPDDDCLAIREHYYANLEFEPVKQDHTKGTGRMIYDYFDRILNDEDEPERFMNPIAIAGIASNGAGESGLDPTYYDGWERVGPNSDPNANDLVLSRTHHVDWAAYVQRMLSGDYSSKNGYKINEGLVYYLPIDTRKYRNGSYTFTEDGITTTVGEEIEGFETQELYDLFKEHLTPIASTKGLPNFVIPTVDPPKVSTKVAGTPVTVEDFYYDYRSQYPYAYPGVGIFRWTGSRAYQLQEFADRDVYPEDTNGDGHSDAMYALNTQLSYFKLEDYADVFVDKNPGTYVDNPRYDNDEDGEPDGKFLEIKEFAYNFKHKCFDILDEAKDICDRWQCSSKYVDSALTSTIAVNGMGSYVETTKAAQDKAESTGVNDAVRQYVWQHLKVIDFEGNEHWFYKTSYLLETTNNSEPSGADDESVGRTWTNTWWKLPYSCAFATGSHLDGTAAFNGQNIIYNDINELQLRSTLDNDDWWHMDFKTSRQRSNDPTSAGGDAFSYIKPKMLMPEAAKWDCKWNKENQGWWTFYAPEVEREVVAGKFTYPHENKAEYFYITGRSNATWGDSHSYRNGEDAIPGKYKIGQPATDMLITDYIEYRINWNDDEMSAWFPQYNTWFNDHMYVDYIEQKIEELKNLIRDLEEQIAELGPPGPEPQPSDYFDSAGYNSAVSSHNDSEPSAPSRDDYPTTDEGQTEYDEAYDAYSEAHESWENDAPDSSDYYDTAAYNAAHSAWTEHKAKYDALVAKLDYAKAELAYWEGLKPGAIAAEQASHSVLSSIVSQNWGRPDQLSERYCGGLVATEYARWFCRYYEHNPDIKPNLEMADDFYYYSIDENWDAEWIKKYYTGDTDETGYFWEPEDPPYNDILNTIGKNVTAIRLDTMQATEYISSCIRYLVDNTSAVGLAVTWAYPNTGIDATDYCDVDCVERDGSGEYIMNNCTSLYVAARILAAPSDWVWSSCDRGVMTAVRLGGLDDDFPLGNCGKQVEYLKRNHKWYKVGELATSADLDLCEPGDVIINKGHVMLFTGTVGGKLAAEKWPYLHFNETNCKYSVVHSSRGQRGPRFDMDLGWAVNNEAVNARYGNYEIWRCVSPDGEDSVYKKRSDRYMKYLESLPNGSKKVLKKSNGFKKFLEYGKTNDTGTIDYSDVTPAY